MIKIYLFIFFMLTSNLIRSEGFRRYSFGFGIQTLDIGYSQLLRFDYQKSFKKNWFYGFSYIHSSFNGKFSTEDYLHVDNTNASLHYFNLGHDFTYPNLLELNETKLGSIKLTPYRQQFKENLMVFYLNNKKMKNCWEFSYSFGLGLIHYNYTYVSEEYRLAYINYDIENEGIYFMLSHFAGLSIDAYLDINVIFHFENGIFIGQRLSLNYDIIDFGGLPLKNDFFVGIKY
jgi:hypothetical protein